MSLQVKDSLFLSFLDQSEFFISTPVKKNTAKQFFIIVDNYLKKWYFILSEINVGPFVVPNTILEEKTILN